MTCVAVVAHSEKQLGRGLAELRLCLADHGVTEPLWFEFPKSSKAPDAVDTALDKGADLLFVWGGDGTVQRTIDTIAARGDRGSVPIAILPAGTANLLATNLGIEKDLEAAVWSGLTGSDRVLDIGLMNGEHFAVMGGIGLDALMIKDAGENKTRLGRGAYVVATARRITTEPVAMSVKIDGEPWFKGDATCVLVGNVGRLMGGLTPFPDARPDDGYLDVAVITADGPWQWTRALTRTVTGHPEKSDLLQLGQAKQISVKTAVPMRYEMDGGARNKTDRLKISVVPRAVTLRVPAGAAR